MLLFPQEDKTPIKELEQKVAKSYDIAYVFVKVFR